MVVNKSDVNSIIIILVVVDGRRLLRLRLRRRRCCCGIGNASRVCKINESRKFGFSAFRYKTLSRRSACHSKRLVTCGRWIERVKTKRYTRYAIAFGNWAQRNFMHIQEKWTWHRANDWVTESISTSTASANKRNDCQCVCARSRCAISDKSKTVCVSVYSSRECERAFQFIFI